MGIIFHISHPLLQPLPTRQSMRLSGPAGENLLVSHMRLLTAALLGGRSSISETFVSIICPKCWSPDPGRSRQSGCEPCEDGRFMRSTITQRRITVTDCSYHQTTRVLCMKLNYSCFCARSGHRDMDDLDCFGNGPAGRFASVGLDARDRQERSTTSNSEPCRRKCGGAAWRPPCLQRPDYQSTRIFPDGRAIGSSLPLSRCSNAGCTISRV